MSDIDIARKSNKLLISEIATKRLGLSASDLYAFGKYKAKLSPSIQKKLKDKDNGKLILVTAISPTPAGEGKTTTTVGLGDGLNRIGKKAVICLREPSLGPCFGIKGGAAGGGYAQVVPMEDINLHFTGDFHAITSAHNLLSAMLDNHIHHGNELDLDARTLVHKRVLDMNDRALRQITCGMGGKANGYVRQDGFDITVASEVMAIFCLASSLEDLKQRLGNMIVGYSRSNQKPVFARDLNADGAMTALLKDAFQPNLVQTLENNPALVHGGPFANIAHGCNSVSATMTALKLGDYVITEAGFGADLGAEKFIDIKCRMAGLRPQAAVLVATIRALKFHGGVNQSDLNNENLGALEKGFANLERHWKNIVDNYGLKCIVAINQFSGDSDAEIELIKSKVASLGGQVTVATHWAHGGAGTEELANMVVAASENKEFSGHKYVYPDEMGLWEKIEAIAQKIYGAAGITADKKIREQIKEMSKNYPSYPVCIAKTQMSFSTDPLLKGAPTGHYVDIKEVRVSAGAGFIVVLTGNIMTMPGLPKKPSAELIDVDQDGNITGLF